MKVNVFFWIIIVIGILVGIGTKKAFPISLSILSVIALIVIRTTPPPAPSGPTYSLASAPDPNPVPRHPPPVDDPTMNTQLFDYSMTSAIEQPEPVKARQKFLQAMFA